MFVIKHEPAANHGIINVVVSFIKYVAQMIFDIPALRGTLLTTIKKAIIWGLFWKRYKTGKFVDRGLLFEIFMCKNFRTDNLMKRKPFDLKSHYKFDF